MESKNNIAVILHLYYHDLWHEFKNYLQPIINDNVHLYVTLNDNCEYLEDIKKYSKQVFIVENRGMDFGPFIFIYNKIKDLDYKYIIKIHSKKSLHTPNLGDYWRKKLMDSIFINEKHFNHIINFMNTDEKIYMASCEEFYFDKNKEFYNHPNRIAALPYINKVNEFLKVTDHGSFFAGSMFIVSKLYLDKLFNNVNLYTLYEQFEYGYLRDSFAHGMERVIGYGVEKYNGKYLAI